MKKLIILPLLVLSLAICQQSRAQLYAIKTSLPALATTNLNLGVEMAVGKKVSLELHGYMNPWKFTDNYKFMFGGVQPGVRYWLRETYGGSFFGLHGGFAAGEVTFNANRYKGYFTSVGVSYGYAWMLGVRWNMEVEGGLGYYNIQYKSFDKTRNDWSYRRSKSLPGPTKLSLNLVYLF